MVCSNELYWRRICESIYYIQGLYNAMLTDGIINTDNEDEREVIQSMVDIAKKFEETIDDNTDYKEKCKYKANKY